MVIIETDFLVALASKTDKYHEKVKLLLEKLDEVKLSPYSLIEIDLLITSKSLIVRLPDFYNSLKDTFNYYGISIIPPNPSHFVEAWILRRKYNLTFFDSLHAATALEENEVLVSFDRGYERIEELRYKHPSSFLLR